ncbi:hypothetical protein JTE90_019858 [Oedothorax gibbosus]|uniref:Uncharacterized protein n=1 Tax=Oedothorax gibbosus TaxID=931172 RepID=A0AAV6VZX7_9ARAC|nr:hypothetical protein JTE90_019858 [Oedothorax gibbosus]
MAPLFSRDIVVWSSEAYKELLLKSNHIKLELQNQQHKELIPHQTNIDTVTQKQTSTFIFGSLRKFSSRHRLGKIRPYQMLASHLSLSVESRSQVRRPLRR